MKRIISLILSVILVLCSLCTVSYGAEVVITQRAEGFEGYIVGKTFTSGSGTFRAFGNYSDTPKISKDVAYEGEKSLKMSNVCHTSASLKILNFLQRNITEYDVGKTYTISFMLYPDKTKGVYASRGETPDKCKPFTEAQLKETVSTEFRLLLAGPDAQNYKYRQGNNTAGEYLEFNALWDTWNKIEFEYTVDEKYLDNGSNLSLDNPYINSLRLIQNGVDYSINQGIANTYYVDNFTVKCKETVNPTTVKTHRVDDMESYETGKSLTSSSGKYRAFGGYSSNPVVSEEQAYDGKKSIRLADISHTAASVKVLNFLQRKITSEDVGKTYRISLMMYADKSKGIYSSVGNTVADCVPFTDEAYKNSQGTRFNLVLTGPDGSNYKYRQTCADNGMYKEIFVPWNEWTEVAIYYTVDEKYLDDETTESLTNPYINSLRIIQSGNDFSVNQGLCNTFYLDSLKVSEVDAKVEYARESKDIVIRTEYLQSIGNELARTVVSEYDTNGKLINAKVGSKEHTGIILGNMNTSFLRYTPKSDESEIYVTVLTGMLSTTPASTRMKIDKRLPGYGFVTTESAKEWAEQMLALSTARYKDAIESDVGFDDENAYYYPVADKYFDPKSTNNTSGNAIFLVTNYNRFSALGFDVSNQNAKKVSHAYVRLYAKDIKTTGKIDLYAMADGVWSEDSQYNELPAIGEKLGTKDVQYKGVVYYYDVTNHVNNALSKGHKTINFILKGDTGYVEFMSMEGTEKSFKPALIMEGLGMNAYSKKVSSYDHSNYIDVMKRKKTPADEFEKTPTRILSSVKDYTPVKSMPRLSKYGGWIDGGKYEATGFFYTKEIDGRWWIIDPEGYKMIYMAVTGVSASTATEITKTAFERVYGTKENWQLRIHNELRQYGFNSAGSWSSVPSIVQSPESAAPLNVVGFNKSFINTYDLVEDNMLNVFDPRFEDAAESYAKANIAPYADSPYVIGWNTDNEPMANNTMLEAYLTCDYKTDWNIYNYYTAWAWLKNRHGNNATIDDITTEDKIDWVEFVYDRYMKVCTDAIRKYDTNHMIIGPKMDKHHQGAFRGLQNWCDIVGYDYYGNAWTADLPQIEQWYKWAGKPLMNQEWYAKGMDACNDKTALTNQAGVGYTVQTQDERGYYYQSFVLGMLESKIFVGWQWFKYMDNDPSNPGQDVSNIDANKGIITREYEYYTTLLGHMNDININAYNLTQYFDK